MIFSCRLLVLSLLIWPVNHALGQTPDTPGTAPKYSITTEIRTYQPSSRNAVATKGQMKLSSNFLSFEKFSGHMELEYAGVLPDVPAKGHVSAERAGAPVYRVINADKYFRVSKVCGQRPVRWIALEFIRAPTAVGGWVYLSTAEELSQFNAGSCSGSVFWSPLSN